MGWLAASLVALCSASGSALLIQGSQRDGKCAGCIGVLQWNFHAECFIQCKRSGEKHCDPHYPACQGNATSFLTDLLEGSIGDLDFAGTEQLNDEAFQVESLPGGEWGNISNICGGTTGFGVYPFDIATIFYRRTRWTALGGPSTAGRQGGCMEKVKGASEGNYRAFAVQAFERKHDGLRVVVVAAHNPHIGLYKEEISALASAVRATQERTGVKRLILTADTNWEHPSVPMLGKTSHNIMQDIYPEAGPTQSTDLHLTCCAYSYIHAYDRIIAAGFPQQSTAFNTTFPFADEVPPWVALNMHSPVLGMLSF